MKLLTKTKTMTLYKTKNPGVNRDFLLSEVGG